MSEQASNGSSGLMKAFIPGLVLGFVVGCAVGVLSATMGGQPKLSDHSDAADQVNRSHRFEEGARDAEAAAEDALEGEVDSEGDGETPPAEAPSEGETPDDGAESDGNG